MPIKAVIFDMDGVLVNSEPIWVQARIDFAHAHGRAWSAEDHRKTMGRSTHEWAEIMKEMLTLDLPPEAISTDIINRMAAAYEVSLPALPGSLEAVHTAASGYRVALASGSPTPLIHKVLALTGLDKVFEVVVLGDDIANGKPAPDIYFEAARRLGIDPREAVGVEDSPSGVRALAASGMGTIAVPSPGFPLPDEVLALAHKVLPSLESFSLALVREFDHRAP